MTRTTPQTVSHNPGGRVAPAAVYEIAPGLGHFTDDVLFGEVWKRGELCARDRSFVTVAALISTGKFAQIRSHVRRALDNGIKAEEIGEVITHLAFYSGWPNAMSAVAEVKTVFDELEIGPIACSEAARIELEATAEAARVGAVNAHVAPTSPLLAELTNRVLFGDLWQRPELAPRDRSLVTMAALIAIGQPEQLPFHANRAMDNGLTRAEIGEAAAHLGFYVGWPRSMSAVPVLEKVFAARGEQTGAQPPAECDLRIVRCQPDDGVAGPDAYFTGQVRISTRFQADAPARIGGATVSFSAGARTAWHTHPLGQTLYIVSGKGWVQKEGGSIEEVGPGDIVSIPPHLRHWHGASATEPMVHFAIAEALDGSSVIWMEKVTDREYRAGLASRQ